MDFSTLPSPRKQIQKVLIANRGEIARRVIKTCKKLGISTVSVYSASDASGVYVREADESVFLGASEARESYLCIDKIIKIAKDLKVDAIHPGYGFLSENADFSAACMQAGIIFIGPTAESILSMGSKSMSKKLLKEKAPSIPLIPGYNGTDQSDNILMEQAKNIGFPVLLKASAGGGGKGMRIVRNAAQLKDSIDSAKTESQNSFGDSTLLIEKYFDSVRHIEFQIFGDEFGNVIHINERECSVQRRHQKVIEESPSVVMTPELRTQMGNAAIAIGKVIGYVGAGTVEFIVDQDRKFYFLEVNTRLQVEHPITEAVTGLDLVEIQIQIARGYSLKELGLTKGLIPIRGHAVECRLYAEDPANDFFPCTGSIIKWHQANFAGLRYDTGIESGSEISIYYDPMISKIITHAESRELAIDKMVKALKETIIFGLVTNKVFLQQILLHPEFRKGNFNTHFIGNYFPDNKQRNCPEAYINDDILIAATLWDWLGRQQRRVLLKNVPSGWRNNAVYKFQSTTFSLDVQAFKNHHVDIPKELVVEYQHKASSPAHYFIFQINKKSYSVSLEESHITSTESKEEGTLSCTIEGTRRNYQMVSVASSDSNRKVMVHNDIFGDYILHRQPKLPVSSLNVNQLVDPSRYVSPMPGKILRVLTSDGQNIKQGDPLLVMESMKMESKIYAQKDGVLKMYVKEGDLVEAGAVLAEVK